MNLGDPVRSYEDWNNFNEGQITAIDEQGIRVDFLDWVKLYQPSELVFECAYFTFWRALKPGVMIIDYR